MLLLLKFLWNILHKLVTSWNGTVFLQAEAFVFVQNLLRKVEVDIAFYVFIDFTG